MLTQKDLNGIENLMDEKIREAIKGLPTRDELYTKLDEIMGELRAGREERELIIGRVYDNHEPRIVKLEETVGLQTS